MGGILSSFKALLLSLKREDVDCCRLTRGMSERGIRVPLLKGVPSPSFLGESKASRVWLLCSNVTCCCSCVDCGGRLEEGASADVEREVPEAVGSDGGCLEQEDGE